MSDDAPLIFITYRDEGWMVSAPDEPSESGLPVLMPPEETFTSALESALDLADTLSGGMIVLTSSGAKIALREMRRRRRREGKR